MEWVSLCLSRSQVVTLQATLQLTRSHTGHQVVLGMGMYDALCAGRAGTADQHLLTGDVMLPNRPWVMQAAGCRAVPSAVHR
jgi:hypothetical protein